MCWKWNGWFVSDCNAIAARVSRTTLKDCRAARRLTKKSSSPTASPLIVSMRITEERESDERPRFDSFERRR
jgi:hypothetical protein